jgi:hypothetical protein
MRFAMYVANAHLINQLNDAGSISEVLHNGYDVVQAKLPNGSRVAFHFIERDIDVALLAQILKENAAQGLYTLFILWGAMLLPENGEVYPPYDWMQALLWLYEDRIYGFEVQGERTWIYPVHFERIAGRYERNIRYGPTVNFAHLGIAVVDVASAGFSGQFRIADFEDHQSARARRNSENTNSQREFVYSNHPLAVHYQVLGISLEADLEAVRKAYRQLAMLYHPDLNKTPAATEKMQAINTAYRLIVALLETE